MEGEEEAGVAGGRVEAVATGPTEASREQAKDGGDCAGAKGEWASPSGSATAGATPSSPGACERAKEHRAEARARRRSLRPGRLSSRGPFEDAHVVVGREMRAQQPHGRQAEAPPSSISRMTGKAPRRSCDRDAVVGLLLGQAEDFPAVARRASRGPHGSARRGCRAPRGGRPGAMAPRSRAARSLTRATSSASESCRSDARRSVCMSPCIARGGQLRSGRSKSSGA